MSTHDQETKNVDCRYHQGWSNRRFEVGA